MKYISPRKIMTFSISTWIILSFLAPMDYTVNPSRRGIIFLLSYIVSFYFGSYFFDLFRKKSESSRKFLINEFEVDKIQKIFRVLLVVSLVGIGLRFVDLFAIKDYLSYDSAVNYRLEYNQDINNYGIVSILSSFLFPTGVGLAIFAIYFSEKLSRAQIAFAFLMYVLVIIYSVLLGGRTLITLTTVMLIISWIIKLTTRKKNKNTFLIHYKKIILICVGCIIFFIYSMKILMNRLNAMGFTISSHLNYMEKTRNFVIDSDLYELAVSSNFWGPMIYTFISIVHYFLHGFYEFFILTNSFNSELHTYGAMEFYPIWKFLNVIGYDVVDIYYLNSIIETKGVYTTFFGPVFVDFGPWGFIYTFFIGLLSQLFWLKVRRNCFCMMIYPFLASVLLHSSFLNMIRLGMGLYVLISLILTGSIIKFFQIKRSKVSLIRKENCGSVRQ